jgi:hypothetical protein
MRTVRTLSGINVGNNSDYGNFQNVCKSLSPFFFPPTVQITHPPTVVSDHVMHEINVSLLYSGELSSGHNIGLLPVEDQVTFVSFFDKISFYEIYTENISSRQQQHFDSLSGLVCRNEVNELSFQNFSGY